MNISSAFPYLLWRGHKVIVIIPYDHSSPDAILLNRKPFSPVLWMCLFLRGCRPERLSPESTTWLCKDAEGHQGSEKNRRAGKKEGE